MIEKYDDEWNDDAELRRIVEALVTQHPMPETAKQCWHNKPSMGHCCIVKCPNYAANFRNNK